LTWKESAAKDFDYFTVYGSNTDSFGAATLVDYCIAPAMDVTSSPYVFYFVTATTSRETKACPRGQHSHGCGRNGRSATCSRFSNFPNPFNPRTTVSYTVPSRGRVTISIYDARGALVATLFGRLKGTQGLSVDWDGRAAGASVAASGVYFARIEQNGATRSKKMVLLK